MAKMAGNLKESNSKMKSLKLIFIALALSIIFSSIASAGITKEHEKDNPNKYGKEKIVDHYTIDIFGWFDEPLAEYVIEDNTEDCLTNCHAQGKVLVHTPSKVFDDVKFYNDKNDKKSLDNSKILIQKNQTIKTYYGIYEEQCSEKVLNGTLQNSCEQVEIGQNYTERLEYYWDEYKGEELDIGIYSWRIEATKGINDNIDWVASAYGLDFTEWAWWNSTFTKCQNMTIGGGTTALNNFTFYVNVTYAASMQADFDDVRFVDHPCGVDGTQLAHELDFKVDSNSAGYWITGNLTTGANVFSMYYGSASATTGDDPLSTWRLANVVYHFSEGTGTQAKDSKGTFNLTLVGAGATWANGQIGKALRLDGTAYAESGAMGTLNLVTVITRVNVTSGLSYPYLWDARASSGVGYAYWTQGSNYWSDVSGDPSTISIVNVTSTSTAYQNRWQMHTIQERNLSAPAKLVVGDRNDYDAASKMNATIDELIIWKTGVYNFPWLNRTYDNTNGSSFYFGVEVTNVATPTITASFSYPINLLNTTDTTPDFGCNFTSTVQNISSVKINVYNASNTLNYTNTVSSLSVNSYNATWTSSLLSDGSFKWECFGFGSQGVNATTGNRTLNIDSTAPIVSIIYPVDGANYTTLIDDINYTINDSNPSYCHYSLNNGSTNSTPVAAGTNWTGVTFAQQNNSLTVYCNDTLGNIGSHGHKFLIDSINPNNAYQTGTETNGSNITRTNIQIIVYVNDTNMKNVSASLYNATHSFLQIQTNTTARNQNATFNFTGLSDGTYYFNTTARDHFGNINNTQTRRVTIDSTAPSVSITFPAATTYIYNVSNITYSISDTNLQACWFTNNSGAINYTMTCGAGIYYTNATTGSNTWRISANDSFGNSASASVIFSQVNYGVPNIYYNSNTETNGSLVKRNNIFINVSASETNLKNITINLYNSAHTLIRSNTSTVASNNSTYSINQTGLADGLYYFNATAETNVSTRTSTTTRSITLDTTAPILTVYEPRGDEATGGLPAPFNITYSVSESNLQSCWYNINGGTNTSLYIGNPNQTTSSIHTLLDYYKFNQNSGTSVNEAVTPGFTMTADGEGWVTGYSGNGFNTTTYGISGTGHLPVAGNNKVSGGVWVKKDKVQGETEIISLDTNVRISEGQNGGTGLILRVAGPCSIQNDTEGLPLGVWTHIGFIVNTAANSLKLYKNGVEIASGTCGTTFNVVNYYFGRDETNSNHFQGVIDELFISNSTSSSEVMDSYYQGKGRSTSTNNTAAGSASQCLFANATISSIGSTLYLFANDSLGNLATSTVTFANDRVIYSSQVYETGVQTIAYEIANISYTPTNAYINYAGVEYPSTIYLYSGGRYSFNNTFDIATAAVPINVNFSWRWYNGTGNATKGPYTQTINPIYLSECNLTSNSPYINFTFRDETTLNQINGSLSSFTVDYWTGRGVYKKQLIYYNTTEKDQYKFCFGPVNATLNADMQLQYTSTGYYQRLYSSAISYLNSTATTIVLDLLGLSNGVTTQIQVTDNNGNRLSSANVTITRSILGTTTTVSYGQTDDAGAVSFFLSPLYSHTMTVSYPGCTTGTKSFFPTSQLTIGLACSGSTTVDPSASEKVIYQRSPRSGEILSSGLQRFDYSVWMIPGLNASIAGARFDLVNLSGSILATNSSTNTTAYCNSSICYLTLYYNLSEGSDIKGRYYVDLGSGYRLLEGDAHWIVLTRNSSSNTGYIKRAISDLRDFFATWNSDGVASDATTKKAEFTRIVFLFLVMAIAIALLGKFTGYEAQAPGSLMWIVFAVVAIGSLAGGVSGEGLFYYDGLTAFHFINNYILAGVVTIWMVGYYFSINRRQT